MPVFFHPALAATLNVPGSYANIQDAINAAGSGDTVLVASATYSENINFSGKSITVRSAGGAGATTLRGAAGSGNAVVSFVSGEAASAVLDGFTIDNQGIGAKYRGIRITAGATPTIQNCVIAGNVLATATISEDNYGAGIYINGGGATISNTTIGQSGLANQANKGSGLYATAGLDLTLTNCTVSYNSGRDYAGISLNAMVGTTTLTNTNVVYNTANGYTTGGICSNQSSLTITGGSVSNNSGKEGAGLRLQNVPTITTIDNVAINSNNAGGYIAGGIYSIDSPMAIGNNSSVSNNTSRDGAGIYLTGSYAGFPADTKTLIDSTTINGNNANGYNGGGILSNGSPLAITNSAITSNSGKQGSGLRLINLPLVTVITNTQVDDNIGTAINGGAIYAESSPLTITGGSISRNTGSREGAGLYLAGSYSGFAAGTRTVIDGTTIAGNSSGAYAGGGIYANTCPLAVMNSALTGNSASIGAAMYLTGVTEITVLDNVTVTGNASSAAIAGGTIVASESPLAISNSNISDNTAARNGAGLYITGSYAAYPPGTRTTVSGSTVRNNITAGNYSGGGIYTASPTEIVRTYVQGNRAGDGGGIYAGSTLDITNCVITGNTADRAFTNDGGGVRAAGATTILNSTISGNYAWDDGGGLYGDATVTNSIVYGNDAGDATLKQYGGVPTFSWSDVGQTGFPSGTSMNSDPMFVDFQTAASGLPTTAGNFRICGGAGTPDPACSNASPCIDGGTGAGAPADDIEGDTRNGNPDIGADEYAINATTVGVATAVAASITSVAVTMPYSKDDNHDNTYTVDYKLAAAGSWTNWVTAAAHVASPYATTITGLTPEASYDFRMTYNDGNGVSGTNPQTVTVTMPKNPTTTGTATATPANGVALHISMPYTDDVNADSTCSVEYKPSASGTWLAWGINPKGHSPSPFTDTITGLARGGTYDARLTYHDADGVAGSNPQIVSAITLPGNTAPDQPVNSSPADAAAGVSRTPTLVASVFSDPEGDTHEASQWQLAGDAGFASIVYDTGPCTDLVRHAVATTLANNAAYHWRVRYRDSGGLWSAYSAGTALTTGTPLPASTVAHWRFDENSGTTANDSAGTSHGTVSGAAWITGNSGTALSFNGSSDDVSTPLNIEQAGGQSYTFEAWVKPASTSAARHFVVSTDNGWYDWTLLREGASWAVFNGSGSIVSSALSVDVDTWQHLVAVFDDTAGRVILYKNGAAALVSAISYDSSDSDIHIGSNQGTSDFFDGVIDEVVIYHAALSSAEVMARYLVTRNTHAPGQPANQAPAQGATGVAVTPTLTGSAFADFDPGDAHTASRWRLRQGAGTYGDPVTSLDSGPVTSSLTSYTVPVANGLALDTGYFWSVQYKDSSGLWSPWSAETGFTTGGSNAAPDTPTTQAPAGGATVNAPRPTLTSSAFSDPDGAGDSHAASQWRVATASGNYTGATLTHDSALQTASLTSYALPADLAAGTTCYWQVRHRDQAGAWSAWSAEATFDTAANFPPDTPTNGSPAAGATVNDRTPTLTGSAYRDVDGDVQRAAQWQIGEDSGFATMAYDSGTVAAATSHDIASVLANDTTYSWRLRYQDSQGNWSGWSAGTSFATGLSQPDGVVAYWKLDDGSGTTAADSSVVGIYDGEISGATWTVNGKFHSALTFDGVADSVSTPLNIDQGGTQSYTFEAWVRPAGTSAGRHEVVTSDNGWFDWSLLREGDCWAVFDGSGSVIFPDMSVDVGVWQHLAAVFDHSAGQVTLYKNGRATAYANLTFDSSDSNVFIGSRLGTSEYFDGVIDEVVIYNRALSAAEIRARYDYSAPGKPSNGTPANGATGVSRAPALAASDFVDADEGDFHAASRWQIRPANDQYGGAGSYDSGASFADLTRTSPATAPQYQRPITLAPATPVDGFQVKITLTAANTDNYANMKADGSDLRFYDAAGAKLPYWLETWNTGGSSTVWVKVKTAGTSTVYLLYGDALAVAESDADQVFELYDNFDSATLKSGWSFFNPGGDDAYTLTERPGWLRIKVVGDSDTWNTVNDAPFLHWDAWTTAQDFVLTTRQDGANVSGNRYSGLAYIRSLATGSTNKGYFGSKSSTSSVMFSADGYQGSTCATGAAVHHLRFRKTGSTLEYDWSTDGESWNNCGIYTLPSVPRDWGLMAKSWSGGGSFNTDYDYFHVRKYAASEPAATVGAQAANGLVSPYAFAFGTTYFWRLQYEDSFGAWSSFSDETSFTTVNDTIPSAPSGLAATASGACAIDLAWTDNANGATGNETGFAIERKAGAGGSWLAVATVAPNTTTYSDSTGLAIDTTCFYRVRATNSGGHSGFSNEASAATTSVTCYQDSDGDTYGNPAVIEAACQAPAGYVTDSADCDDTKAAIHPATVWYQDVDGDGYASGTNQVQCAAPGPTWHLAGDLTASGGDCNDDDPAVHPGLVWFKDADADGYSDGTALAQCVDPGASYYPAGGLAATSGDCNDAVAAIRPGAVEECDGADNDCDGSVDEGFAQDHTFYRDADGDTYGDGYHSIATCQTAAPSGYVANSSDCDDGHRAIHPAATEYCNGRDDNCNGQIDEACTPCAGTLAAPSGLTATAVNSRIIRLEWADNSDCEEGFVLEAQSWNGLWTVRQTLGPAVSTFTDTVGIEPQKQYRYRVKAARGSTESTYSNEALVTTPPYAAGDRACE
ncbi:MAG: DUF2341 domain-containing protein [Thermodesulfobacteriota bacterium]